MRAKDMNEDFVYTEENEDLTGAIRCGCISLVGFVAAVLMAAIMLMLFTGCKHVEYVTVPERHTDTLYVHQTMRDSIYLHDSTFVRVGGDTVLIERWRTQYRDRWRTDTLRQVRTDSVAYPVIVEKKVEVAKEPSMFQKLLMGIGWLTLTVLLCMAFIKLKKYLPGGM